MKTKQELVTRIQYGYRSIDDLILFIGSEKEEAIDLLKEKVPYYEAYKIEETDMPQRKSGRKRVPIPYSIVELLVKSDLSYKQIADQEDHSYYLIKKWANILKDKGIIQEHKKEKIETSLENDSKFFEIDALLRNPGLTYTEIEKRTDKSYRTIRKRANQLTSDGVELPERKKGRKKGSKDKKHEERNKEIVECALSMFDSLKEIGDAYGLTREGVRQIILRGEVDNYDELRKDHLAQIKYKNNLNLEKINLLNILRDYETFLELTEERGENYALAWRVRDVYGWGKKHPLETIERLIELWKDGNGLYRCVRLSGLANERSKITSYAGYIKKLLEKALHDIDYEKPEREFNVQKYFVTDESIERLLELEKTDKTYEEISELLEIPKDAVSYHLKRLGIRRKPKNLDYNKIDPRIMAGEPLEEIAEDIRCSTSTLKSRRAKLNKRNNQS